MTPSIFEYLPKEASIIWKMAEAEKPVEKPIPHALKTVGSGLGLMGIGTLAGYGGGALIGKAVHKLTGKRIPPGALELPASLAGAGLSLAYKQYKDKELEELRRVVQSYRNRPEGGVPGK